MTRPVDDRRFCTECAYLSGGKWCKAAGSGLIVASRNYEPWLKLPRRCPAFVERKTKP